MSPTATLNDDFRDLLESLLTEEADFVVVGAHALAAAGVSRATKDLDILVRPSRENAARVYAALRRFGAPLQAHGVTLDDLEKPGMVYQLGLPPRRIDITTQIEGVEFNDAWSGHIVRSIDGISLPFLGLRELVRNKRSVGRVRDLLDIELLREAGLKVDD